MALFDSTTSMAPSSMKAGGRTEHTPTNARSAMEVVKLMKSNDVSIKCVNCSLKAEHMKMFSDNLRQGSVCEELFLGANEVGSDGVHFLAEAMKLKVHLRHLDLGANLITSTGAHELAECLKLNFTVLSHLNLSYNSVGDLGAYALGEALKNQSISKHPCPLRDLNLQMNEIPRGEGIENIAEALKQVPSDLMRLNLAGNMLGVDGGRCMAEALAMNTTLEHLDLSGTMQQPNIEAQGVKFIAGSLRMPNPLRQLTTGNLQDDHFCLTYLNLANNRIDDAVGKILANELKLNHTIKQLILKENFIGPEAGRSFADMLCMSKSLKRMDLSANALNATAGEAFAEMLKVNKGLRHLNLSSNRIGSQYLLDESLKGIPGKKFAEALPLSRTLEHLDLGGCGFDYDEEEMIIESSRQVAVQNAENHTHHAAVVIVNLE